MKWNVSIILNRFVLDVCKLTIVSVCVCKSNENVLDALASSEALFYANETSLLSTDWFE